MTDRCPSIWRPNFKAQIMHNTNSSWCCNNFDDFIYFFWKRIKFDLCNSRILKLSTAIVIAKFFNSHQIVIFERKKKNFSSIFDFLSIICVWYEQFSLEFFQLHSTHKKLKLRVIIKFQLKLNNLVTEKNTVLPVFNQDM